MGTLILGTAAGFLMASVFVTAAVLMLFSAVRNTPPALEPIFARVSPSSLALGTVVLGYPTWGAIGAVMSVLYTISVEQLPGGGIGSPNQAFTLAVLVVAVAMSAPFLVLLRRRAAGVVAIGLGFAGVFGWLLPFFAA